MSTLYSTFCRMSILKVEFFKLFYCFFLLLVL
nr:MAG TPA_asm: hypothetical protein [Caudoviricetes sp.]